MVWSSYPVVRHALGLALAGWVVLRAARRLLSARRPLAGGVGSAPRTHRRSGRRRHRSRRGRLRKALLVPAALVRRALLHEHVRRRSRAQPGALFAETLRKKPAAYDLEKVRAAYPLVASYLGVANPDPVRLDYSRRVAPPDEPPAAGRGAPARRPNVVIVLLESFAAYKTGAFGNPLDPTPRFDALAREGTLYTRFFTPTWGTARSVWATVTGLPDVESTDLATRNPLLRLPELHPQRLHRLREALLPRRQPELGKHPRVADREHRRAAPLRGGQLHRAPRRYQGLSDLTSSRRPAASSTASASPSSRSCRLRQPPPLHHPGEQPRLRGATGR